LGPNVGDYLHFDQQEKELQMAAMFVNGSG
jgi:hypothetical protein